MDWILLIFVVPLILVPIVLLCGFAGCAQLAGIDGPSAPPVSPPSSVTAKALDSNTVELTWKVKNQGFGDTFRVERAVVGPSSGGPSSFLKVLDGFHGNIFDDDETTGLVEGTTFRYRISRKLQLQSGATSAPSAEVKVTTLPNAPTNLATTSVVSGQVDLTWLNTSAKADKFRVERRSPPNVGAFMPLAPLVTVSTFQDRDTTSLTAGSSHEYQVVAIVSNGFDNNVPKPVVESKPSVSFIVSIPAA